MKNLVQFIIKFHFLFLFLFLQFVAVWMVVTYNVNHRNSFINSSNIVSGFIYETYSSVNEYFKLKSINRQLSEENAALRDSMNNSFYYTKSEKTENTIQQFTYMPCKVINNSTNRDYNYFTLNKGELQGIDKDMAVISSTGAAGIIVGTSKHYSIAISLLNVNFKLSAKLKKTGQYGTVIWKKECPETALLVDIPSHIVIYEGDSIVTSGFSSIFPEGIMVGTIKSFERKTSESFYEIEIKLSTDFNSLHNVYVIENRLQAEQLILEETNSYE